MRSPRLRLLSIGLAVLFSAAPAAAQWATDASFDDVRLGYAAHEMRHAVTWHDMASLWQPHASWSAQHATDLHHWSPWQAYAQIDAWAGWRLLPGGVGMPAFSFASLPWLPHPAHFGQWSVPDFHDVPCVVPVPEPASTTLAFAGGLALWVMRRKRGHR